MNEIRAKSQLIVMEGSNFSYKISWVFAAGLFSFLLVYGYEWVNFSLSIDEEVAFFGSQLEHYLILGRWGLAIRVLLFPELTPYVTPLACGLFIAGAASLITYCARLTLLPSLIFAVALASFPQFAYQLEFSQQADGVALGFFLATAATCGLFMMVDGGFVLPGNPIVVFLGAVVAYSLAFSFYQAIVIIPVVVAAILTMFGQARNRQRKPWLRQLVMVLVAMALGVLLYQLVLVAFRNHYHVVAQDSYLADSTGWAHGVHLHELLHTTWKRLQGVVYYGEQIYLMALLAGVAMVVSSIRKRRWLCALFIVAVIALQALFDLVFLQAMQARVQMGEGLLFASLLALFSLEFRRVGAMLGCFALSFGVYACSQLFYSDKMAGESDARLAQRIDEAVYQRYPQFDPGITPVYIYGSPNLVLPWQLPNAEFFGESIFKFMGGNVERTQALFHYYDIMELTPPEKTQRLALAAKIALLPQWPNRQSIQYVDGVLVVKLGEGPGG